MTGNLLRYARSRWIVLLTISLLLIVPLIALGIAWGHGPQVERDAYANLEIVARLKTEQVERWLADRLGDGQAIAANHEIIKAIAELQRSANPGISQIDDIRRWLDSIRQSHNYPALQLIDPQGKASLTLGEQFQPDKETLQLIAETLDKGVVEHGKLHLENEDTLPSLNIIAPLQHTVNGERQSVAAALLHLHPDQSIFPLILAWPSASASGETLLVAREGDSVVFLNTLRHASGTALKLKRPVSDPLLPAAIAVRAGIPGTTRGKDHRGIDVLAAYRPVAGTNWHIVAKIDRGEAMAPLWNLVFWITLVASAALVAVSIALALLWRQQKRTQQLAAHAEQLQQIRESEARFRAVAQTARDAIVTADAAGRIVGWNPAAERMFGFSAAEITGQDLTLIIPERYHKAAMDGFRLMMNGDPEHKDGSVAELTGRRKDDSEVLVERAVSLWETAAGRFYTCTMRDIGERKHTEKRLRESEAMLREAQKISHIGHFKFNPATGHVEGSDELFNIFGLTREQFQFSDFAASVHPDQREFVVDTIAQSLKAGAGYDLKHKLQLRDGTIKEVRAIGTPLCIADGDTPWLVGTVQDITEARQSQRALESSRRFNEQLLAAAPIGIISFDEEGKCLSGNVTAARLLGATHEQLLKANFRQLDSWKTYGLLAFAEAALTTGESNRNEIRAVTTFGKSIWLDISFSRFSVDNRNVLVTMFMDISARKVQEECTRQLLMENETILSNALVGIVYLKNRCVVSCNQRFEKILGYGPGELIGKSSALFYDTDERFQGVGKRAYAALAVEKSYSEEVMLRRKDGTLFHGALNGCAIDQTQPDEGSIWIYADISERRQAEEESRKLLKAVEQASVTIVITNKQGIIEYVNPSFTRITGFSRREAIGQNPNILASGETPEETYQELWATISAGIVWHGVLLNRRKDGITIWEDTTISPIFDDHGVITHFVAVKEDVTEKINAQQELIDNQVHLEKTVAERTKELRIALDAAKIADQAKDSFLANVTHELRTPLSAVIGFSGLARPLSTDPRQQEYLDKITSAGKTLSSIIDDLLDLSKIAAGRMTLETTTFSLHELLARSQATMSFKAEEKGLQLNAQIDEAVPDVLFGDPLRLEQILLNLLSNAVKFTADGRVELRVKLHASEEDRVCLNIEVEDSGIGMQEEDLELLFKPFSQTDASMSRKFGGTGLGLAICKRIAELMGGNISVRSQPGSGTTFTVQIWLSAGNPGDLEAAALPGEHDAQRVSYRDARVLVVDDQPFNRDVVEGLLAAVGIRPRLAVNGREALDLLLDAGPAAFDLVLMDVQMPVMDGMTATRELRAHSEFAELPVVAMTAHTMAHEKELSKTAGMDDHIGKPFDDVSFYRVLKKWIPLAKQHVQEAAPIPAADRQAGSLPQLRGIDMHAGLSLLLGDEARYRHWLSNFVDEGPGYITQIFKALAAGEPAQAALAAHTLKGRGGMLGMGELHSRAAALELALDSGEPAHTLLIRLEQTVEVLCAEIRKGLGLPDRQQTTPESDPGSLPEGPLPESIAHLIAMLEAGNSDSDTALADCLEELAGTPWVAHLKQALADVENFDFSAAAGRFSADGKGE